MLKINSDFKSKANPHHPDRNEDTYLDDQENEVFAVFDGMGGLPDAQMAAETARNQLKAFSNNIDKNSVQTAKEDLKEVIKEAHNQVYKKAQKEAPKRGLGTTASILTFLPQQKKGVIVHCGDSRIYQLQDGVFKQLTQDHDMLWEAEKKGKINQERAKKIRKELNQAEKEAKLDREAKSFFEGRNILSSSLGGKRDPQLKTKTISIKESSIFLLCTDGIHDNLTRDEIKAKLKESKKANNLIKKATKRSQDNTLRSKADDLTAGIVTIGSV